MHICLLINFEVSKSKKDLRGSTISELTLNPVFKILIAKGITQTINLNSSESRL